MNEDQIRGAANTIGGRVQRAAGALSGQHDLEAEGAVRETAGRVQQAAGDAVDTVRDQVAHRPLAAVLSGFGVGILVGLLIARRD
ncbi:CsbD family protein [Bacillus sp. NP157]|nr:CsbD family protein [Bacillus sp. NP157]